MTAQFRTILCPVDFSTASHHAFEYALKFARIYGSKIRLLHVVSPVMPEVYSSGASMANFTTEFQNQAMQQIERYRRRAERKNIPVVAEVKVGSVLPEIQRAIVAGRAELVIAGTHGHRGFEQWILGSVVEKLMRHCPVPLLAVSSRAKSRLVPAIANMVVTTDFSDGTPDALTYAFSIAKEFKSKVTLLHVIDNVSVDISPRLREPLVRGIGEKLESLVPTDIYKRSDVTARVETGVPWRVILKTIQSQKAGLIVMNVHGKGMLERALMGSTAERVLRGSPCPVLLIPPMKPAKSGKSRQSRRSKSNRKAA